MHDEGLWGYEVKRTEGGGGDNDACDSLRATWTSKRNWVPLRDMMRGGPVRRSYGKWFGNKREDGLC